MVIMAGGYARGRVRTANLVTSVRDPFDKHQEIKTSGRNGKMSQHYLQRLLSLCMFRNRC